MADTTDKFIGCFNKVRQVIHHYWMHLQNEPAFDDMCVPNITKIISKMSGVDIIIHEVDVPGSLIRGTTLRYPHKSLILIRKNQSIDWRNFSAVKELCHILLDEEGDYNIDITDSIRNLTKNQLSLLHPDVTDFMRSELLAEYMAIEILYPIEMREEDILKYKLGESLNRISIKRNVPLVKVEIFLDEDVLYFSRKLWTSVSNNPTPHIEWD